MIKEKHAIDNIIDCEPMDAGKLDYTVLHSKL